MKMLLNGLLLLALACQSAPAVQDSGRLTVATTSHTDETHGEGGGGAKGFAQISVDDEVHGALSLTLQRDGKLSAELDGAALPPERLQRDGDHLRVLDASGATLYDLQVFGDNRGLAYPYGESGRQIWLGGGTGGAFKGLMNLASKPRHVIGVVTTPVDGGLAAQLGLEPDSAVVVNEVSPGMPAEKAGLKAFDVITSIDGVTPVTRESLRDRVTATEVGRTLKIGVLRRGQPQELDIAVGETKDEGMFPRVMVGDAADEASRVWNLAQYYGTTGRDEAALEKAHAELERAHVTLERRIEELSAQAARGGAEGEAASKAADELKVALEGMADAQASMQAQADDSPEVRFFNVGAEGDKGLLLRRTPSRTQWKLRDGDAPSGAVAGQATVATDAARMAELEARIAQLDARVAELVKALEESGKKP
ncbi:MAG TPA: PDZ domain-containing protein [Planctomycetota bacterium]|nr:PDZ domain-containing protein [Planctomycetota bacterium]